MGHRNIQLITKLDESDLTQGAAARQAGISETRFTRIMRGYVTPTSDEVHRICSVLGCCPSEVNLPELKGENHEI